MNLITNKGRGKNHKALINKLILTSDEIIMSSGWMKEEGLMAILPNLEEVIKKNVTVTIYSNQQHTETFVTEKLKGYENIKHIMFKKKTLHSKIYYFKKGDTFTAIIGSANITYGGLVHSEELSVKISNTIDSDEHIEIKKYLDNL